jgi:hypothetical protein
MQSGGDIFHPEDEPPALIFFVSHRWESLEHPDPMAHQLKALQYLLRYIPEIAALQKVSAAERIKKLPSIRIHGVLQAALILGSTDTSEHDLDNIWQKWGQVIKEKNSSELLDHIGIWYDYSCMPQTTPDPQKRAAGKMFENLTQLPDLVQRSVILILREYWDDYSERGWCAAEVAAARRDNQLIVLRKDLLGQPISDADLFPVDIDDTVNTNNKFFRFRSVLDRWESKEDNISLWYLYVWLSEIKIREEDRIYPLLTTKRNPEAFPQQKELLTYFISLLEKLSTIDKKHRGLHNPFDLGEAAMNVMKQVGLRCTESWDIVFVCLSIMRSRHHPGLAPFIEQFYRTAIERWVKGESMKLTRFRERRKGSMSWEVWYLLEGESQDVRVKPGWVR